MLHPVWPTLRRCSLLIGERLPELKPGPTRQSPPGLYHLRCPQGCLPWISPPSPIPRAMGSTPASLVEAAEIRAASCVPAVASLAVELDCARRVPDGPRISPRTSRPASCSIVPSQRRHSTTVVVRKEPFVYEGVRRGVHERLGHFGNEIVTPAERLRSGACVFARRLQRIVGQRVNPKADEETPGTAAHPRRCDPTELWTRRRCASRSEHLGRRPRCRASLHALFRKPCRKACCHNCGRSTGPIREPSRSGSDCLRRKPKRMNRTPLPHMRTRRH